jgi:hypothetical protein
VENILATLMIMAVFKAIVKMVKEPIGGLKE